MRCRYVWSRRKIQRRVTITWKLKPARAAGAIDERKYINGFKSYFIYLYILFLLQLFRLCQKEWYLTVVLVFCECSDFQSRIALLTICSGAEKRKQNGIARCLIVKSFLFWEVYRGQQTVLPPKAKRIKKRIRLNSRKGRQSMLLLPQKVNVQIFIAQFYRLLICPNRQAVRKRTSDRRDTS